MKKTGLLMAVVMSLVIMVACAKPAPPPAPVPAPTTPKPTTPAPVPSPTPAPAAKITWSFEGRFAPTHIESQTIAIPIIDEINKRAGGRLEIKPFWSESLVKQEGVLDAVSVGTIDMGWVTTAYWTGTVPLWSLPFVPSLFNDYQHEVRAWNAGIKQIWIDHAKQQLKAHVAGETFKHSASVNIYSNKSIPKRPSDIKGLKIRSFNPLLDTLLNLAGAAPISMSSSDMYLGVQRGTIDGYVSVPTSVTPIKMQEVTKYVNLMPLMWGEMGLLLISEKSWTKLPTDLQKIVDEATFKYFTAWGSEGQARLVKESVEIMRKAGMTVYEPTTEDIAAWTALAQPVWDKYIQIAGEVGKKQIEIAQKAR